MRMLRKNRGRVLQAGWFEKDKHAEDIKIIKTKYSVTRAATGEQCVQQNRNLPDFYFCECVDHFPHI